MSTSQSPDEPPSPSPTSRTRRAERRRLAATPTPLASRIDALDGVRALAVGLVVAFHVGVPGAEFGFFGVDVFFVLSGFLITTLLLTEASRHGRIDLRRFWARRFLRLLPAALALFAVVAGVTLWQADVANSRRVASDLLWCLAYLGNWHFIASASYFTHDGTVSPLLHVWSLAVEEQFYVVWPCLVATLLLRGRARRDADVGHAPVGHTPAGRVAVVGTLAALVSAGLLAWLFDPVAPERAYMGTDAKVVEPLLGAVASALLLRPAVAAWARRWAVWLALGGTALTAAVIATVAAPSGIAPTYFRGGAVLGCVGVAALIVGLACLPATSLLTRAWGWAPLAYLGRISYGIYLWHWPLAVWAGVYEGAFQPLRAAGVVLATVALAATSYHLLETPLRRRGNRQWRPGRVLVACGAIVGVLLGGTVAARAVLPPSDPTTTALGPKDPVDIVVVGDSVPQRMTSELVEQARRRGRTLTNLAVGGCAATGTDSVVFPELNCAKRAALMQQSFLAHHRPQVVIWWSRWELVDLHRPGRPPLTPAEQEFWQSQRRSLTETVTRLTAHGAHVLFVEPERPGQLITALLDGPNPAVVATVLRHNPHQVRDRWISLVKEVAANNPRLLTTSIEPLVCRNAATPCDDRLPLRRSAEEPWAEPDDRHLSRVDGEHYGPEGRTLLASTLVERALALVP